MMVARMPSTPSAASLAQARGVVFRAEIVLVEIYPGVAVDLQIEKPPWTVHAGYRLTSICAEVASR